MAGEEVDTGAVIVEYEYIQTADLKDVESPEACMKTLVSRLDSKDWLVICEALNNVRQMSLFHPRQLAPKLGAVVGAILNALKNPRSALVKTCLMATCDIFTAFGDAMLQHLDAMLLQLLLKASEDKRFVAGEAEKALAVMASHLSPRPLLHKLQPYSAHKSPKVRAKAAVVIRDCAAKLDTADFEVIGFASLIRLAGGQVSDQLPEARDAGKKTALLLHAAFEESEGRQGGSPEDLKSRWQRLCQSQLSVSSTNSILRITS